MGVGGSVVECSPATRAARVRFPADALRFSPLTTQFQTSPSLRLTNSSSHHCTQSSNIVCPTTHYERRLTNHLLSISPRTVINHYSILTHQLIPSNVVIILGVYVCVCVSACVSEWVCRCFIPTTVVRISAYLRQCA